MAVDVAILGASGYAGGELIRLADGHPELSVAYLGAHRAAGQRLHAVHPQLAGGDRVLGPSDTDELPDVDLVFLALPHGASAEPGRRLRTAGVKVVDLGSDYRLHDPARYVEAYGDEHPFPDELGRWPYGLPELFRDSITRAGTVAVPGCYPTATALALAPLLAAELVEPDGIVVDAVSGVTGAGRSTTPQLRFGAVAESVRPYAVGSHRHRPEMEQTLSLASGRDVSLVFTPHLVPMQRGLLATCTARLRGDVGQPELSEAIAKRYAGEPFVDLIDDPPETRWVVGSNRCLVSVRRDRTGSAIVMAALDNLVKGAAGQAVQCANLMLGLPEATGLSVTGWLP